MTRSKANSAPSAPARWRDELRRTIELNRYIPVRPTPRQGAFLAFPTLEVGYGGAAGGGKSVALLMAALQYVNVPGYNALLIRRTFADLNLPDALIPMSHQWLSPTDADWNGQEHRWTFPSGATLTFGYCENYQDVFRYQGAALAFVGWDELTQFPEFPYRYLFSRLRKRVGLPVPLRIRSGFNPGGIGHDWVRARFVDGQTPQRRFVPALLEDNPHLDRDDYETALAELDPVTRAQLRHGDWNIRPEGNLFRRDWFDGKYIDTPPRFVRTVRCWDLAGTEPSDANPDPDYTAGVKIGQTEAGEFVILDAREFRVSPAEVERNIRGTADEDGRNVEVFIEQEPGASGKSLIDHYQRRVLAGFSVFGVRSSGDKITRAKPFSAACQNGLVKLLRGRPWVGNLLDRLTSFGMKGQHDDMTDAAAGAHRALTGEPAEWTEGDFQSAMEADGVSLDGDDPDERLSPLEKMLARKREGVGSEIL